MRDAGAVLDHDDFAARYGLAVRADIERLSHSLGDLEDPARFQIHQLTQEHLQSSDLDRQIDRDVGEGLQLRGYQRAGRRGRRHRLCRDRGCGRGYDCLFGHS